MKGKYPENLPKPGEEYEIPPGGSLGLLSIGYKGILAWRKKRAEVKKAMEEKKSSDGK
jgi:hypothetical protein